MSELTQPESRPRNWKRDRDLYDLFLEMAECSGEITPAERAEALSEYTSDAIADFLSKAPSFNGCPRAMAAAMRETFPWATDAESAAGFAKYVLAAEAVIAKALHDVPPAGSA